MSTMGYGFERTLPDTTVTDAVSAVTESLRSEGFGVLTTIDVRETLKAKLGVDFRPYVILGACNPKLAHEALSLDPQIGLLLPCNVVVQESAAGAVSVSVIDPVSMFKLAGDSSLEPIAKDVATRLSRALDALK